MQAAVQTAHAAGVPIWFEPVSVPKSVRASKALGQLTYISPNAHELIAMALAIDPAHNRDLAQRLLLQMAAGSKLLASEQLKLLSPFLLSVLQVGSHSVVFCACSIRFHTHMQVIAYPVPDGNSMHVKPLLKW